MKPLRTINVRVPRDLHDEFTRAIPRGLRTMLVQSILSLILDAVNKDGKLVLGAIMSGEYRLSLALDHRDGVHKMNGNSDGQT